MAVVRRRERGPLDSFGHSPLHRALFGGDMWPLQVGRSGVLVETPGHTRSYPLAVLADLVVDER